MFGMLFLFLGPFALGLANSFGPRRVGAGDLAFPRLNAFSYWVFLGAGLFIYSSVLFGLAPNDGWFNYVPLSQVEFTPDRNIDFYALGLIVAAVTDRHVRIGDMAAGTLLIYVDEGAAASLDRSAVRIGATGLDPGQMELLDALLRRWRQLDAGRRMELGGRLLETICRARGEPVPEVRNLRDLRRRLRGIQRAGSCKDAG